MKMRGVFSCNKKDTLEFDPAREVSFIMSGRGRSRKAKSPDHADFTEKQKQKKKKEEQKNANNAEEKAPLESTRRKKTANHCTEEVNKHQSKSTDSTPAKTSATRTKLTENPPVVKMKTPKDSPKIPKKGSGRAKSQERLAREETPTGIRKAKTSVKKAKSPEMFPEEMTKTLPHTPKDTTEDDEQTGKAEACGTKPKLVQFPEQVAKKPKQCLEKIKTERQKREGFTKDMTEKNPEVDCILKETLEKLKIKKNHRSEAASIINTIKQDIIKHLKEKTVSFKKVQEPLPTGSYYENLKICNPDEFDIMVPILVDRANVEPFGDDGAFYSVALKRDKNPLQKFQENDHLSASKMLSEFRDEVKNCVKIFTEWKMEKKKKGCPAVTLITKTTSVPISLDVVLCLMVNSSWPSFTKEGLKIERWLGSKVKQEYKRKPYYLVPKYEGRGTLENDGVLNKDVWRVSFSHVEKAILKNHGSEKTCCEKGGTSCCRKSCLKLLKYLLQLLKERDSSFDKFCSYHGKTTLLHACCSRTKDSEWRDLSHCFQLLLEDFENYLEEGQLQNFFIPSQNLLSGISVQVRHKLSRTIRDERLKGFPIFREQLQNPH